MIQKNPKICEMKHENAMTLLYIASRLGFRDLVALLLNYGCSVNNNNCGSTPLHAACYFGHACVVSLLIENGESLTLKNKYDHTPCFYRTKK
jgi:ankyrin repeat protein